jgi:hypothetical protein
MKYSIFWGIMSCSPLEGRPRRRWIDNIKKHLLEIGVNVVDWIGLDRYRIGTGGELL